MYGGVGLCVDALPAVLSFEPANELDLSLLLNHHFSLQEVAAIENRLSRAMEDNGLSVALRVSRAEGVIPHIGLGTGTRVALSATEALLELNKVAARETVVHLLSGRGGASGQGIHAYFHGGLSLDIGRLRDLDGFHSSDVQGAPRVLPLTVATVRELPWDIVLVVPQGVCGVPLHVENAYFQSATPLPDEAVFEAAYVALFGVFGSAADGDYAGFCRALNRLQKLPWKSGEAGVHGEALRIRIERLRSLGADAVIMSSMGPTLMCMTQQPLEFAQRAASLEKVDIIVARMRAKGRDIFYE